MCEMTQGKRNTEMEGKRGNERNKKRGKEALFNVALLFGTVNTFSSTGMCYVQLQM